MVAHAVLALEALLAHRALVGLLVRVRQLVSVQVVDVAEGLPAHLAGVVLPDALPRGGRGHHATGGHCGSAAAGTRLSPSPASSAQLGHAQEAQGHHGGHLHSTRGDPAGLGSRVDGFVPPEIVAVLELLGAQSANIRPLALCLLLQGRRNRGHGDRRGWGYDGGGRRRGDGGGGGGGRGLGRGRRHGRGWRRGRRGLLQGCCVHRGGSGGGRGRGSDGGSSGGGGRSSRGGLLGGGKHREQVHLEGLGRRGLGRGRGRRRGLEWTLGAALGGKEAGLELSPDLQGVLGVTLRWREGVHEAAHPPGVQAQHGEGGGQQRAREHREHGLGRSGAPGAQRGPGARAARGPGSGRRPRPAGLGRAERMARGPPRRPRTPAGGREGGKEGALRAAERRGDGGGDAPWVGAGGPAGPGPGAGARAAAAAAAEEEEAAARDGSAEAPRRRP